MVKFGLTTPAMPLNFGKQQKKPASTSKSTFPSLPKTQADTFHKSDRSAVKFGGGGPDDTPADTDAPASSQVAEASSHAGTGVATTAAVTQANASAASVTTNDINPLQQELFALLNGKTLPSGLPFVADGEKDKSRGRQGEVFRVGPNHVLKAPYEQWKKSGWQGIKVISQDQIVVNPRQYDAPLVSQRVANVNGTHDDVFTVHHFVPGKQGSVPYIQTKLKDPIPDNKYDSDFLPVYKQFLRDMATMPPDAYEGLMRNVKTLDAAGDCIDPNANNLMVDTKSKRLGLVDIDRIVDKRYPPGHENNLNYILTMLIDHNFWNWEFHSQRQNMAKGLTQIQQAHDAKLSAQNDPVLLPLRREILKKALQAACTQNFVRVPDESKEDVRLYKLMDMLKTGGLNDAQCIHIMVLLDNITDSHPSPAQRAEVAKAIGKVFDNAGHATTASLFSELPDLT